MFRACAMGSRAVCGLPATWFLTCRGSLTSSLSLPGVSMRRLTRLLLLATAAVAARRIAAQGRFPPDSFTNLKVLPKNIDQRTLIDRKSTRLNSSHGYISYAVFCLKKKKQKRHNI